MGAVVNNSIAIIKKRYENLIKRPCYCNKNNHLLLLWSAVYFLFISERLANVLVELLDYYLCAMIVQHYYSTD